MRDESTAMIQAVDKQVLQLKRHGNNNSCKQLQKCRGRKKRYTVNLNMLTETITAIEGQVMMLLDVRT
jgi:hypothetical protein